MAATRIPASIDVQRNRLYATTGDNYSAPASNMSDSFVAMDLDTGKILWARQMTAGDAWNTSCRLPDKTNCPDVSAPDFDAAVDYINASRYGNAASLFTSAIKRGTDAGQAISVSLSGRSQLRLVVTNAGDGADSDHADWADAKLACG